MKHTHLLTGFLVLIGAISAPSLLQAEVSLKCDKGDFTWKNAEDIYVDAAGVFHVLGDSIDISSARGPMEMNASGNVVIDDLCAFRDKDGESPLVINGGKDVSFQDSCSPVIDPWWPIGPIYVGDVIVSDPIRDATTPGWYTNDWFGWFYLNGDNWIYQNEQGWLYKTIVVSDSGESFFFWSATRGWIYTTTTIYPYGFVYDSATWVDASITPWQ